MSQPVKQIDWPLWIKSIAVSVIIVTLMVVTKIWLLAFAVGGLVLVGIMLFDDYDEGRKK